MQKLLSLLSVSILVGSVSTQPRAAGMDWPAFFASVPGYEIQNDREYKTSMVKRSPYQANSSGMNQIKDRVGAWCKGQQGNSSSGPSQDPISQAFSLASSAWFNQVFVQFGERYQKSSIYCTEAKSEKLIAVFLIDAYMGYRGGPHEPDKWPNPVIAFYTPEQALAFAEYYNNKEKERTLAAQRESQQRSDRHATETRRLRTLPMIGDQTAEGVIVDLRPPLVQIQYNAIQRQMFGKPQSEWVPISSLTAAR